MTRPGGVKWSLPAVVISSCCHQVCSASATHSHYAGPKSHQCTSGCGKWGKEKRSKYGAGTYKGFVLVFLCGCVLLPQLEQVCQGETPALPDVTITEPQNQSIQAILELAEQPGQVELSQVDRSTTVLGSLDLISRALCGEKSCALCSIQRNTASCLQSVEIFIMLNMYGCSSLCAERPGNLILFSCVFLFLYLCLFRDDQLLS